MKTKRLVVKTLHGLEEVLAEELTSFGAEKVRPMNRSVECFGDREFVYRANLMCRTASRILQPIAVFPAAIGEELYRQVSEIDWSDYLHAGGTLAIDPHVSYSTLTNSLFVAQKTKDAIVDQLRTRSGQRPSVDLADSDLRVNVHIYKDQVTLSLDSSGNPLHQRGYRTEGGKAPINEVLAAGIISLTGWDMSTPFVDGMCGSGTFVIEAALMARRIAPGLLREKFGFMRWPDFDSSLFAKVRSEVQALARDSLPFELVGSDMNKSRIKEAAANAGRAGVAKDIRFEQRQFEKQTPPSPPGLIVLNPPYGERLKEVDIARLYKSIGDTLKQKYQGYTAFILTANLAAAKSIGLRSTRKIQLYNGPLECRLLRYAMYSGSLKTRNQTPE
jgi:putative N6-adenine-specific DNA methylase